MPLEYSTIKSALAAQPLFEDKTWRLSPEAWPLPQDQRAVLADIGVACVEFLKALETLYLRSASGKNLLRNRTLLAPWVAEYLDRGKPGSLVAHGRDPRNRGRLPPVIRPDLLLTEDGFVMTELDSVPGGIGLTAFLNRLYGGREQGAGNRVQEIENRESKIENAMILGADDAMILNFHAALASLRPDIPNPLIAIAVSDEAATYRPEMEWLAQQLQVLGHRVFCIGAGDIFPLGDGLCFDVEGNPEKIDVLYRFFELFDLPNIRTARFITEAWAAGELAIAPPMRPFQEEKLCFALFHHHLLQDFWGETLSGGSLRLLRTLIPPTWVIDPTPLPPGAVLDGPRAAGRALNDWRDLAGASQRERDLVIKISGYHETAWGARSVVVGSDCSREEWAVAVQRAVEMSGVNLHIVQAYRKPRRLSHPVYDTSPAPGTPAVARPMAGRVRLCPYYFPVGGDCRLSGALATFCPPDKKVIHGMLDAALLPLGFLP